MSERLAKLNGVFAVAKPAGESSARTVARVKDALLALALPGTSAPHGRRPGRALAKALRVGHGGTLDPMATGVLVIGVGRDGCRALGSTFLKNTRKAYSAEGVFGSATDSYDSTGIVTAKMPWEHVTREAIVELLEKRFSGEVSQRPPPFSAVHVNGERAYDIARRQRATEAAHGNAAESPSNGAIDTAQSNDAESSIQPGSEGSKAPLELPERTITLFKCEMTRFAPPEFALDMECSSGTYVRTVIHDLGHLLGSAAHMTALSRTAQGPFALAECVSVESLSDYDSLVSLLSRNRKLYASDA